MTTLSLCAELVMYTLLSISTYSQNDNLSSSRSFSGIARRLAGMHPLNWLRDRCR